MTVKRDTWVAIGLLIVLVIVTIGAGIQQSRQQPLPAYYSQSAAPDGTLALRILFAETGYRVLADELETFAPPAQAKLIFVFEPQEILDDELAQLEAWVQKGNTLVAAGQLLGFSTIAEKFDFSLHRAENPLPVLSFQNPLLTSPVLPEPVDLKTSFVLATDRTDFISYLGNATTPALVSFVHGKGRVILLTSAYPFSNAGLKEPGMPALLSNILALANTHGPVWFDEWHHGIRAANSEINGPSEWLRRTPGGRALLFVAFAIFVSLLLQGRLFGKPIPVLKELRRRAPLEYITAIANLGRRAGHRQAVMRQYHAALKRGLGKRYRLDPSLPDDEYVNLLSKYNPHLDQSALLALLTNLNKSGMSESEMVRLAAAASEWLQPHQMPPYQATAGNSNERESK